MQEKGYSLLSSEERKEQYKKLMISLLSEYYLRTRSNTMKRFENSREEVKGAFRRTLEAAKVYLHNSISAGQKGKVRYIQLSYLLSNALSGERLIKVDFYDERYYRDIEEIDCYWDFTMLFPEEESEYLNCADKLRGELIRLQSGELSQLKIGLMVLNFMVLKEILRELVKSERLLEELSPYCGDEMFFIYGAYLDQAEVIHHAVQGSCKTERGIEG